MSTYRNHPRRPSSRGGRPLGFWDRIPAGVRAALINTPIVFGLFLINSIGLLIFSTTTISSGLVCYSIQILAYIFNGWLAGYQARATYNKSTRMVGKQGETVRTHHPNYLIQGVFAGLLLWLVGVAVYFMVGATASSLLPGLAVFASSTAALFLVVDLAVAMGGGIIGSLIYGKFFD